MSIFVAGRPVTPGAQTHLRGLYPGKDYVFQYKAPPISFALLSQTQMAALVQGWVKLRPGLDDRASREVITITGVSVNTGTGDIFIRGSVSKDADETRTGVNPYAVAAIIASVFAHIGVGITLLYTYEVAGGLA